MSSYLSELKTKLVGRLSGYRFIDKGPNVFVIVKEQEVLATVKDQGDYIIVTIAGKDYKYDKWYTKPEHLANVLVNYFSSKS
ncbi:MAG: hypothetical protein B6U89_00710 [Desulfurococcales archaeon ex4484_58]|nr:MAG: hypothetical protein B6U89_00710 [Desulfurococcales archaeon ex4484_58]